MVPSGDDLALLVFIGLLGCLMLGRVVERLLQGCMGLF